MCASLFSPANLSLCELSESQCARVRNATAGIAARQPDLSRPQTLYYRLRPSTLSSQISYNVSIIQGECIHYHRNVHVSNRYLFYTFPYHIHDIGILNPIDAHAISISQSLEWAHGPPVSWYGFNNNVRATGYCLWQMYSCHLHGCEEGYVQNRIWGIRVPRPQISAGNKRQRISFSTIKRKGWDSIPV